MTSSVLPPSTLSVSPPGLLNKGLSRCVLTKPFLQKWEERSWQQTEPLGCLSAASISNIQIVLNFYSMNFGRYFGKMHEAQVTCWVVLVPYGIYIRDTVVTYEWTDPFCLYQCVCANISMQVVTCHCGHQKHTVKLHQSFNSLEYEVGVHVLMMSWCLISLIVCSGWSSLHITKVTPL